MDRYQTEPNQTGETAVPVLAISTLGHTKESGRRSILQTFGDRGIHVQNARADTVSSRWQENEISRGSFSTKNTNFLQCGRISRAGKLYTCYMIISEEQYGKISIILQKT